MIALSRKASRTGDGSSVWPAVAIDWAMKIDGARNSPVMKVNPKSADDVQPRLRAREVRGEERAEEDEQHHDPVLKLERDRRRDEDRPVPLGNATGVPA